MKVHTEPTTETQSAIDVRGLSAAYGDTLVLDDLSFEIPAGVLAAVVGPNGAGKTTLMKSLLGLHRPLDGNIRFPLLAAKGTKHFRKRIGYVPQCESIDWDFPITVLDVVLMGCYGRLGWLRRPRQAEKELACECLARVGLLPLKKRQIGMLSGGQRQRVFLARALMQDADIYLMDEPFKGIDAKTERIVIGLLQELKTRDKTIVVVHHDLQTVPAYFDWVALINVKRIASGATAEVFHPENIAAAYGAVPES